MPTVQNQRHERFAQEVAKGKSSTDAYIAAGYDVDATVARAAAARLLANVSVKARVEELKEQIAAAVVEETGIDRMEVLRHLGRIATAPLGDKDVSPSVKRAALMDYAKIEGWVIERSEVGQPSILA